MRLMCTLALLSAGCQTADCVIEVEDVGWDEPVLGGPSSAERIDAYVGTYTVDGEWYDGMTVGLDFSIARGDTTAVGTPTKRSKDHCHTDLFLDVSVGLSADDSSFALTDQFASWLVVKGRGDAFEVSVSLEPSAVDRDFFDLFEEPEAPVQVDIDIAIDEAGALTGLGILYIDEDVNEGSGESGDDTLDRFVDVLSF